MLPSSARNRTVAALALCMSIILSIRIPVTAALACYETINDKTTIAQNDSWTYCALVPASAQMVVVDEQFVVVNGGNQFGLGPEDDMTSAYNSAFAKSVDEYRILAVCIYERYDFAYFSTLKPADLAVKFAFRCLCNYNLCNSEPTFSAYLSAIKAESFERS